MSNAQQSDAPTRKVTLEYEGKIAVVRLNHPEVMNAVGAEMLADFIDVVDELGNSDARCMLLTGTGRGFCAGANLQSRDEDVTPGENSRPRKSGTVLRTGYHPLLFAIRELEIPVVTAVNGAAAGVGMSFALMGDIVCASKQAFFLQAFAKIGLVPDGGSTFLLPRLIGWGRAMELSMLAERLPAEQALEWGLINRLYDDNDALLSGAMEIARKLADGPRSLALIRRAYWDSWQNNYEQQLDLEARLQNEAGSTSDFKEGVSAFLEKRDAAFTGD